MSKALTGDVLEDTGIEFARGLASYGANDGAKIIGLKTEQIEAVLGYAPRGAMVHRDNMVVLDENSDQMGRF